MEGWGDFMSKATAIAKDAAKDAAIAQERGSQLFDSLSSSITQARRARGQPSLPLHARACVDRRGAGAQVMAATPQQLSK